jgi:hypothetical protein
MRTPLSGRISATASPFESKVSFSRRLEMSPFDNHKVQESPYTPYTAFAMRLTLSPAPFTSSPGYHKPYFAARYVS